MSPETILFARLTYNDKRVNLGRATIDGLLQRAREEMRKIRKSDEMIIQIEMATSKLPDSTTFNKSAMLEQEFQSLIKTDLDEDSPFPGIKLARVVEVMGTEEYERYQFICQPDNRMGLDSQTIEEIKSNYFGKFPDCAPHFPGWVD